MAIRVLFVVGKAIAADEGDPWKERNAAFAANDRLPGRLLAARVDYCLGLIKCSREAMSKKCAIAHKIMRLTHFTPYRRRVSIYSPRETAA
jgi:hypothetical protein